MPIKGLSDKGSITPRFPRLGKLRKGGERVEKIKDGKKYTVMGPDLDHFRFTSADPELVSVFEEVYGKEPRSIMVYLPYASVDENFPTWCELWNASGLVHRCDGETMNIWLEGDKYIKGSKPCTGGHKENDPLRDGIGRLSVIIPEFIQAGHVGFVTVETHSKNDIVNITSVLSEALQQRGDNPLGLRGIQFVLRRVSENISVPGFGNRAGQRARTDKWLIKIEPAVEWVRLQMQLDQKRTMLLPESGAVVAGEDLPEELGDDDQVRDGELDPESEILDGETIVEEDAIPEFKQPWTSLFVTEAQARAEKSSDGIPYFDMTMPDLANRLNGIAAKLKKNGLTDDEKNAYSLKRDIIKAIVDYKTVGEAV